MTTEDTSHEDAYHSSVPWCYVCRENIGTDHDITDPLCKGEDDHRAEETEAAGVEVNAASWGLDAEAVKKVRDHYLASIGQKIEEPAQLRMRDGDQPLPVPTDLSGTQSAHELAMSRVNESMTQRASLGLKRYGQPLLPFNGRDSYRDLEEEVMDALAYMSCVQAERQAMIDVLKSAASGQDVRYAAQGLLRGMGMV